MNRPTDDPAATLAALVQSTDDAVVSKTLDGVITSWNPAAEKLFGYRAEEAIGQPITLIIPPDRLEEEQEVLRRLRRGEAVEHFETVRVTKGGERISVSLTASPIRNAQGRIIGASKIARGIGERLQMDEIRARLAAIVDSSDDAIVSKTLEGVITSWNRTAERMFGYTAAEAVGQPIWLIIPPDRVNEEHEVLRRLRRGEPVEHFETIRRHKDGRLIEISLTTSPVRDREGRIIGASKIARDVTERRRAAEERALLLREAQESNRAKDEFLAMLGHELRNPLGAISSAILLLRDVGSPDPAAKRARDVITRQTQHLSRLVDDLLDVGRVMTGKILLEREPLDLAAAVTQSVGTMQAGGRLSQHHVTVDATPVWVAADVMRLEQIIANLIGNAVKYTPAGGAIRIAVKPEGQDAVLEVEDTGIGLSESLRTRVFELFVQGDRRLDRTQGGLGIGLTLVKRLAEMHGGTVEAFSEGPELGSRFTVRLHATAAPALPAVRAAQSRAVPAAARRVLVVEDNPDAREMLVQLLRLAGHEVHEAEDGRQGLEAALRLHPDVALIDVGLPELDGFEIARRIRERPEHRGMYLVALTGYGAPADRQRSQDAGFDLHLVKPVEPDALASVLQARRRA